jgi:hypothetical protein
MWQLVVATAFLGAGLLALGLRSRLQVRRRKPRVHVS